MQYKLINLREIAEIKAGYPFRGSVQPFADGDAAVVQMKNADAESGIDWPHVVRTRLEGRRQPDWLKPGDILFTARGNRNVAVYLDKVPVRAVCSPHFFLVRIKDEQQALPEFVAWQMNLPHSHNYLARAATGSFITSIRKEALERMPLRLPAMEQQRLLARLGQAARREKELMERLIENRKKELNAVAKELLNQD